MDRTDANNQDQKAPERVMLQETENLWHNLLERCRKILDNEDDFRIMQAFDGHEQVISHLENLVKQYQASSIAHMLSGFARHLFTLRAFVTTLFVGLGVTSLSAACFFGGILLLLEVAAQSDKVLTEIIDILSEFGDQLKFLQIYSDSGELDEGTLAAFFEILEALTVNIVKAIKYFRRRKITDAAIAPNSAWINVRAQFAKDLKRLELRLTQLRRETEAKSFVSAMKSNAELVQLYEKHFSNSLSPLPASMRCHTIPFIRNPGFYGRQDILDMIDKSFREQPVSPTSIAVWGAAGIGKTQIALEYSNRLWSEGFNVIIWISSETNAERAKSYSDAARQLQFSEFADTNTPEQNQRLVLQWLQRTGKKASMMNMLKDNSMTDVQLISTDVPWLLVFDNVESQADLQSYWPTVGQGRILITCRSEILADSGVIAKSFEIPPFTLSESTEMILRITEQSEAPETEIQAAREVSGELGGLALAIDITAKHIRNSRRFRSLQDFIPYLRRNPKAGYTRPKRSKGQDDYWYPHDLDNIWRIAFQSLNEDAAILMNLICILSPESIPQYLFQPRETSMPTGLDLFEDIDRVEDAKDELLDASLVRINSETGLMSVHRLLQHAYFLDMPTEARKNSIHNVLALLVSNFPKRDGANHFYSQWNQCAALHQHIQALRDKVVALKPTEPLNGDDQELYNELIHDDIWYMIEIQHFLDAERSLLSLLENAENSPTFAAKLHRSLLGLYERTGRSIRAKNSAGLEFDIIGRYSQSVNNVVANTWSNMGYTRVSAFEASDGITYLDKAISMAKDVPEPGRYQQFTIDRFLRNRGRASEQLGRFEDALRDFDEAEYYQEKIHGPSSHYGGETQYERAKIEAWRGNLEMAYSLATKAHDLVSTGKPTHASVMAAQYRLGWIAILQSENDLALQHLEKSLVISRINEQHRGNSGESARIQWRMSQVLERMGREGDAATLREAAEKVKASLLATGDYAQVEDEDNSWDALVGLLYR